MYKTHCQCILDTAINANFDEVGSCVHVPVTQLLWKLDFVSALFANVQRKPCTRSENQMQNQRQS